MSFPPFILPCLTVDHALTQLCNQLLTCVILSYICTLKTHICTRYLTYNTYIYKHTHSTLQQTVHQYIRQYIIFILYLLSCEWGCTYCAVSGYFERVVCVPTVVKLWRQCSFWLRSEVKGQGYTKAYNRVTMAAKIFSRNWNHRLSNNG